MEILENEKKEVEKRFDSSTITLTNRSELEITGVEYVYEATPQKFQLKVAGSQIVVGGENLNITQLDVEKGFILINGVISSIAYTEYKQKKNILKRIFK